MVRKIDDGYIKGKQLTSVFKNMCNFALIFIDDYLMAVKFLLRCILIQADTSKIKIYKLIFFVKFRNLSPFEYIFSSFFILNLKKLHIISVYVSKEF